MKSTFSELYRFVYRNVTFLLLCFAFVAELVCNSARFLNLIQQRKRAKLPESLQGKIVLITGANSGIGKETAIVCLKLGATVIMACRNRVKTEEALEEICAELGKENVYENVFQVELDLSSLESVQKCAQKVNSKFPFIDVLINNAGVMMCPKFMTQDNFEGQFGTNYLGHFALTKLLLDKLKSAPSGRIVNLSSVAHLCGQLDLDNLNLDDDCYTPFRAYSRSKLAMLMFTRELGKRLENDETNVRTYAVHPGVVSTEIKRHLHFVIRIMEKVFRKVVMLNAELGAQTTLHCAFSEEVSGETGLYYTNCTRVDNHLLPHVTNRKDSQNLWNLSVRLCNFTTYQHKH